MSGLLKLAPNLVGLQLKLPVYPLPFDMPVMTNLRHLIISVQCMSRFPSSQCPQPVHKTPCGLMLLGRALAVCRSVSSLATAPTKLMCRHCL